MKSKVKNLVQSIMQNPEYMKDSAATHGRYLPVVWPSYTLHHGTYETYVRIYREGYYWLVPVRKGIDYADNALLLQIFDLFNEECYRVLYLYRIDISSHELLNAKQERSIMYYLDHNQQDEIERIKPKLG